MTEIQQALMWQLAHSPPGKHSSGALIHTQLQITAPSTLGGGAMCWLDQASGSPPTPTVLHMHISNQSSRTMATQHVRLLARVTLHGSSATSTAAEVSVQTAFPSAAWTPKSTLHVPIALDSHLAEEARLHVQIAVQVEMDTNERQCGNTSEPASRAIPCAHARAPLFFFSSPRQFSSFCSMSGHSTCGI